MTNGLPDILLYGITAIDGANTLEISHVLMLEVMRVPMAINAGILGAFIVPFVPQSYVRSALIALALITISVICGLLFMALLMLACAIIYLLSRFLYRWSSRRKSPLLPNVVGLLVLHAMYIPAMFVILPPFKGHMAWGELTQFWGLAFVLLKSVHYIRMTCTARVDPFEAFAFRRFLHYLIHLPSLWFGPYQTFRQFDGEVSTCRQRISWKNRLQGAFRVATGVVKLLIIFHWINRAYFLPNGYTGPFSEELFAQASTADPGHLWFFFYLYVLRMYLFISGVSDGVIGMNLMMGIRVPENSRWPFLSRSIVEFWTRWHIQMGAFLRDEVFFRVSLSGNRYVGFFCVFAYCGLWHFVSWSAILAFPLLQVAAFAATFTWDDFWKRHARRDDRIHFWGRRLRLYNSPLSRLIGMIIVLHVFGVSCLFVFDHKYGGIPMLQGMFGL